MGETKVSKELTDKMRDKLTAGFAAGDRIAQLEAENKRLNEQLDAIEEMGTESLNALPDCLMRLAPALVENDELKAKLARAVETLEFYAHVDDHQGVIARRTLAELKGQTDE